MIPRISLRQALADPALLGGVLEGESWKGGTEAEGFARSCIEQTLELATLGLAIV